MRLILNEKKLLSDTLDKHYVDTKKPTNTFKILAKHYLAQGKNKPETYEIIDGFLKKHFKRYNSVDWYETIQKNIEHIQKNKEYDLIEIAVGITKNEVDKIKEIGNGRLEKLAFVLLVYAKIYNQLNKNDNNWVNEELKYIFSDAKIAVSPDKQCKMIYELGQMGLVRTTSRNESTNMKIKFVDNSSNDYVIEISDFRNFVYEYLRYLKPEAYVRCSECNVLIRLKNNRQQYCSKCAREVNIQRTIENRKKRQNV